MIWTKPKQPEGVKVVWDRAGHRWAYDSKRNVWVADKEGEPDEVMDFDWVALIYWCAPLYDDPKLVPETSAT